MAIFMNNLLTFSHLLYEIHIKVYIINVCCYGENDCFPPCIIQQFIEMPGSQAFIEGYARYISGFL